MYTTHVPRIASAFEVEPLQVFPYLVKFVLATIQQQFHTVPTILDEWDELGTESPMMWGMKRDGVNWLKSTKWTAIAMTLHQCQANGDRVTAIDALVQIPGINVIKAAFIAQLVGMNTACLDTQNLKLHGIKNVKAFQITKTNLARTRVAKIKAYLTLCDELGSAPQFWDTWCEIIANTYPDHFTMGAFDVSSRHVEQTIGRQDLDDDLVPF